MWDKPEVLNRITKAVLAFTLLFALWVAGRAALEQRYPFSQVTVEGAAHSDTQHAVQALLPKLAGGFFSMDLQDARLRLETLPWVRRADVRRAWPDRLFVTLEEHEAAAAWNDRATLSTAGEVFPVRPAANLPRVLAPEGMEREVARRYGEFAQAAAPLGLKVEQVVLSPRQSWHLRLSSGIEVELGRERIEERMQRFARFYPQAVTAVGAIARVDMRYPNGFSAQRASAPSPLPSKANQQEKRA
ncbi:MAG: FtsQ-type POTRA domain-containing protein [Betaproteobacteria bacterium]|nr:FtsQ-type POTRA domain-containing protein [Betaproteobacteria bacterium]